MMRSGYIADCRFFRDSDQVVKVKWYRCRPGAPVLGFESAIQPLRWLPNPHLAGGVGEVFDRPQPFTPGEWIPGATGERVCGTEEDFRDGGQFLPDAPPMLYTPEGLSLCCSTPPGGVMIGGEALPVQPGGTIIGGEALPYEEWYPSCSLADFHPVNFNRSPRPFVDLDGTPTPSGGWWKRYSQLDNVPPKARLTYTGVGGGTGTVTVIWKVGLCSGPSGGTVWYTGPIQDNWQLTFNRPVPGSYDVSWAIQPQAGHGCVCTVDVDDAF